VDYLHQREELGSSWIGFLALPYRRRQWRWTDFDVTICLRGASDTRKGFHPDWKTFIFNYGRNEESAIFLMASGLFLAVTNITKGRRVRVDAVASMLFWYYSRKQG